MAAVSNSSPLIFLSKIGLLDLLPALYSEILIPPAVHEEVIERGRDRPGAGILQLHPWLAVRPPELSQLTTAPPAILGTGEVEAIRLAVSLGGRTPILLDDRAARDFAFSLGLPVSGSVGILIAAKAGGYISQVQPHLDLLIQSGLYLSNRLYYQILASVSEIETQGGS